MSQPPFRTALKINTSAEIERINEREGLTYSRAYEAPEQAIKRMEKQDTANEDRLRSWAQHPDERVALYFLEMSQKTPSKRPDYWSYSYDDKGGITQRALQEAEKEGNIWTPLIDKLAQTKHWAKNRRLPEEYKIQPDQQAQRLSDWVQSRSSPRELEGLLVFQAPQLLALVARKGQAWDLKLAQKVLEKGGAEAGQALGQNNNVPDQLQEKLFERSKARLNTLHQKATSEENLPYQEAEKSAGWAHWLGVRAQQDQLSPRKALSVLLGNFADIPYKYQSKGEDGSYRYSNNIRAGIRQVGDNLTADQLAEIAQMADNVRYKLRDWLIEHPEADERTWKPLWKSNSRLEQHTMLRTEAVMENPAMREVIFSTPIWMVAREVGEEASPQEQRTLGKILTDKFIDSDKKGRLGWNDHKHVKHILNMENLRPQDLIQLYQNISDKRVVRKIVEHPSATARVFRVILDKTNNVHVREAVSDRPEACRDPESFKTLRRCRNTDVLVNLCRYGPAQEVSNFFNRLVRDAPQKAFDLLDEPEFQKKLHALNREDFTPLLRDMPSKARRKIFRALGQVDQPSTKQASRTSAMEQGR